MSGSFLKSIKGSGMMFLSLMFAAAILPVVMAGILNPEGLRFLSKADEPKVVRVWFEPSEVVTKPGVKFNLTVMADFDSETNLIPEIKGEIKSSPELKIKPSSINYQSPFRGRVKITEVEVVALKSGVFELEINPESVFISLPDISVISGKTIVNSRK